MLTIAKRRSILRFVAVVLMAMTPAFALGACGGDQSPGASTAVSVTDSSVADNSTATPSSVSSTSTSADSTTPTGNDTTTSLSTATTVGAITTTAGATPTTIVTTTTKPSTATTRATTTTTAKATTTTAKAKTVLKISGPSGSKELSMAELKAMSATSGYGGWKNQLANITAPTSWTGVSLRSLMELVGGGGSVTVVASDGYTATLSAGQVAGEVTTYDPSTGEEIGGVSVRAIVAYAKEGGSLGSSEGPLRIAFVSSEQNQVTDSDTWVRMVTELRVN
jgi:hypothetical protein